MPAPTILICTALAMLGFAANSVLCRMALANPVIDPASFTAIRLVSGAVALGVLVGLQQGNYRAALQLKTVGTWKGAAALFAYAVLFSFAYVRLSASTGALILFGVVQCTMIGTGVARGERLAGFQLAGAVMAAAGLIYLLAPGLHAPDPWGAAFMAVAGIAWGIYSLFGREAGSREHDPTLLTAGNFLRSVPFALALLLIFVRSLDVSLEGVLLAIASGAVASGVGYALWYAALKGLAASEAAIVQLTVPVIAAAGGLALLGETVSWRLVIASVAILGGVALVLTARRASSTAK